MSIVCKKSADDVNLLVFDYGQTDLILFDNIPHLSYPIINDFKIGFKVILSLVDEMDRRHKMNKYEIEKLPYIVCIIDEFPKFIVSPQNKDDDMQLQRSITDLLARGRGAKIRMALIAHDPTARKMKVGTTNIDARIAFKCTEKKYSETILEASGAESLTNKGDLLFKSFGSNGILEIKGSYISDKDIGKKLREITPSFKNVTPIKFNISELVTDTFKSHSSSKDCIKASMIDENNEILANVIIWSLGRSTIANRLIQTEFRIGNNKVLALLEQLENYGLINEKYANRPRTVIPSSIDELSEEVLNFLKTNGYSEETITDIFDQRHN